MDKIVCLKLILLLPIIVFSQKIPELKLENGKFEPVVLAFSGKNKSEIYKKSINWVKEF